MFKLANFVLLAALLSGCGYSLANRSGSPLYGRSVSVSMFANRTYQPNVEGELRRALVTELAKETTGQVAVTGGDLLLEGEIDTLSLETTAFSAIDTARFYRIELFIKAQLVDRNSGRIVWKTSETARSEYPAGADLALQRNAREAAIQAICQSMAKQIVAHINQAF
jgi:outer membrane lipopolysaccharide assembly protein LptE/RlpB